MTVYISTPKGEIVCVNLNWKENKIQSRTKGGIAKLREYGWDIEKIIKRRRKWLDYEPSAD